MWHSNDKIVADGSAVRPAWLLLWGWFASKNVVVVVLASVCGWCGVCVCCCCVVVVFVYVVCAVALWLFMYFCIMNEPTCRCTQHVSPYPANIRLTTRLPTPHLLITGDRGSGHDRIHLGLPPTLVTEEWIGGRGMIAFTWICRRPRSLNSAVVASSNGTGIRSI